MFIFFHILSEPPCVGNLFTSSVYESPVLGTTDDFKSSAAHDESGCEKGGVLIGDSFKEKVED